MESHQKNAGGNARIAETMFRYFRFPKDFPNFVWLSQIQQGVAIKTAVDYWRSLKPHCMGAVYWQLNDTWPVASWSSARLRRRLEAPAPPGASASSSRSRRRHPRRRDPAPHRGQRHRRARRDRRPRPSPSPSTATPPARSPPPARRVGTEAAAPLTELPLAEIEPGEILAFRWTGGERHGRRRRLRPGRAGRTSTSATRSSPSRPKSSDGTLVARVSAEAVALFVTLEADRPGRFSTNAVALFPGHPTPRSPSPPPPATPPAPPSPSATSIPASPPPDRSPPMTEFSYQLYCSRNFPPLTRTPEDGGRRRLQERRGLRRALRRRGQGRRAHRQPRRRGLKMPTGHFGLDQLENDPDRVLEIAKAVGIETIYCPYLPPDQRPDRRRRLARLRPAAAEGRRPLPRRRPRLRLAQPRLRVQADRRRRRCRRSRSSRAAPTSNGKPTSPG